MGSTFELSGTRVRWYTAAGDLSVTVVFELGGVSDEFAMCALMGALVRRGYRLVGAGPRVNEHEQMVSFDGRVRTPGEWEAVGKLLRRLGV